MINMFTHHDHARIGERYACMCDGRVTQTVSICTAENKRGTYEADVRLCRPFYVTKADLERFDNHEEAIKWLKQREKESQRQMKAYCDQIQNKYNKQTKN